MVVDWHRVRMTIPALEALQRAGLRMGRDILPAPMNTYKIALPASVDVPGLMIVEVPGECVGVAGLMPGLRMTDEPEYPGEAPSNPKPPRGDKAEREFTIWQVDQINKAISDEIEAIRMYGRLEGEATDPDAKAVFKNIAKEEMRHKEVLEDLAATIRQRLGKY